MLLNFASILYSEVQIKFIYGMFVCSINLCTLNSLAWGIQAISKIRQDACVSQMLNKFPKSLNYFENLM